MEQNGTLFEDAPQALKENQLAALPYLVAAPTVAEGARLAAIGRTTLYRWMNDDDFRRTLEGLRAQAADLAHTELRGLMLKSVLVLVLAEAMEDSNPGVRLRAAHAALSLGLRAIDLKELQRRVDLLDESVTVWAKRNTRP